MSLYPAALVLALVPLFDPFARAWPFHPADAGWRFLLVSVFIDHGWALLGGLVLALIAALLLEDRLTIRRLGLGALALGIFLVVLVVLLVIHVLLLRREFDAAVQVVDLAVTRRVLAGLLLGMAFVAIWWGIRRSLAALPERGIGARSTSDRIVGQ